MVRGYVAGINRWIRDNEITDPACADAAWITPTATATDLWYGVYMANLLASSGVFLSDIVGADPATLDDPGLPVDLPELPTTRPRRVEYAKTVDRDALLEALGQDSDFGSNATAIGGDDSSTGRGLLLGNPHFPWAGRYKFTQQHLTIPGKYDVAGGSLIGSPVVNIGWNKDVAWSHTVSTAYRFTPYEYFTLVPGSTYLTADGLLKKAEHRFVEVEVLEDDGSIGTVEEDLYRTPQGYVTDSPSMLMGWLPTSFWAIRDANAEHLRTIDTFLSMGEATSVRDLLRRQDEGGGMPWVNTTAADRNGDVLYADHSVVPHVTDDMALRCMTPVGWCSTRWPGLPGLNGALANGLCKWGTDPEAQRPGILGDSHLPDVVTRDWVMNANDSFWTPNDTIRLEGYPGIIGCEKCVRTMRTRMVQQYVVDRLEVGKETPTIPPRARAREPGPSRRGDACGRPPRRSLRRDGRDRGVCRARGMGRALRRRLRRHPPLRGVRRARADRQRAVEGALRRRGSAQHPARPEDDAGRSSTRCRQRSTRSGTRACRSTPSGARCRWPVTGALRRTPSAAATGTWPATPTRSPPATRSPTPTATSRSPTARRTSRPSRTSPTARSCRGRSSPTASTRTPRRRGRRTRPGCSPGSGGCSSPWTPEQIQQQLVDTIELSEP